MPGPFYHLVGVFRIIYASNYVYPMKTHYQGFYFKLTLHFQITKILSKRYEIVFPRVQTGKLFANMLTILVSYTYLSATIA